MRVFCPLSYASQFLTAIGRHPKVASKATNLGRLSNCNVLTGLKLLAGEQLNGMQRSYQYYAMYIIIFRNTPLKFYLKVYIEV